MTTADQALLDALKRRHAELGLAPPLPCEAAVPRETIALAARVARLLAAAKEALRVLDTFSVDDLMEGRDSRIRAELIEAIREMEGS